MTYSIIIVYSYFIYFFIVFYYFINTVGGGAFKFLVYLPDERRDYHWCGTHWPGLWNLGQKAQVELLHTRKGDAGELPV